LLLAVRDRGVRLSADNPLPVELLEGLRDDDRAVEALRHATSWLHSERRRAAISWATDVRKAALAPFLSCILPAALLVMLAVR
jgi:hypothetical protein